MNYLIDGLKRSFDCSGKAIRKAFWMYILFQSIILILIGSIDEILFYIFSIFSWIPTISISVRRIHDLNKSGLWVLIYFVPLIGGLWFLILSCTKSEY